MILIGVGANLPSTAGTPFETCAAGVAQLAAHGVKVRVQSPWYESAPVPVSDQPWFINGVVAVETELDPAALLGLLHETEARFGRVRTVANAARPLDLDLLAYNDIVRSQDAPLLPHPRLHERAFVLLPLRDVAPGWRHPKLGLTAAELAAALPAGAGVRLRSS